jgi:hypothetical protein
MQIERRIAELVSDLPAFVIQDVGDHDPRSALDE